jgi:RNA polymerase sporulation-specific sigma factor
MLNEVEVLNNLRLAKNGDETAKEILYLSNTPLIKSIIRRFKNKGIEYEDLFQIGSLGFIKAIKNFNEDYNVKFSTYAVPMIIGEIRRYLRDNNAIRISRSTRDVAYRAMQAKDALQSELQREPTIEEIAQKIQLPREEVVLALEAIVEPISLYEPVYNDGGDTIFVMDQVGDCNDDRSWLDEITLKDAIAALSDREKRILHLRFFKGLTQVEVSAEIGISQAQVSRLEKGALDKIKKDL